MLVTFQRTGETRQAFLERRANAYQAYYENMPLRLSSLPKGSQLQLYRNLSFGSLAQFSVLDTRQYRTDQPCGGRTIAPCEGVFDPKATILGDAQEAWLKQGLDKSPAKWNILANQVLMARVDRAPGAEEAVSTDQWSGYEACRDRVMRYLADRKPSNPIVITGDIHSSWVSDLKVQWKDEKAPAVGSEFTGTSISSGGDGSEEQAQTAAWYSENPHLKMYNNRRGYMLLTLDAKQCRTDYRTVEYVVTARSAHPHPVQLAGRERTPRRAEGVVSASRSRSIELPSGCPTGSCSRPRDPRPRLGPRNRTCSARSFRLATSLSSGPGWTSCTTSSRHRTETRRSRRRPCEHRSR